MISSLLFMAHLPTGLELFFIEIFNEISILSKNYTLVSQIMWYAYTLWFVYKIVGGWKFYS